MHLMKDDVNRYTTTSINRYKVRWFISWKRAKPVGGVFEIDIHLFFA